MQMVTTTLKSGLNSMQNDLKNVFDNLDNFVDMLKIQEKQNPELIKCI